MVGTVHGACLCGAVRLTLHGALRPVVYCHCRQCRAAHGHVGAYTSLPDDRLDIAGAESLAWFGSSEAAERGFCRVCGSCLLWRRPAEARVSVAAGCLTAPTGLTSAGHIYVASKGDYYAITDGLSQENYGNPEQCRI